MSRRMIAYSLWFVLGLLLIAEVRAEEKPAAKSVAEKPAAAPRQNPPRRQRRNPRRA